MKVLAIGGPSHAGKSTAAALFAEQWSAEVVATDRLARHPGRPWSARGAHVVEYFCSHSVEWLVADVLAHYERMQPMIGVSVDAALAAAQGARVVVEGSAVLPGGGFAMRADVRCAYLTAPPEILRARIMAGAAQRSFDTPLAVACERFADRAVGFDAVMRRRASAMGVVLIESDDGAECGSRIREQMLAASR